MYKYQIYKFAEIIQHRLLACKNRYEQKLKKIKCLVQTEGLQVGCELGGVIKLFYVKKTWCESGFFLTSQSFTTYSFKI